MGTERNPASRLRAVLDGRVIDPGDPRYDDARTVYYSGFDRRPSAVVRPRDATEVARVVDVARDTGVELAVRSGGHSVAGHSGTEGGILLDLSELRSLDVDVERRTAWAGAGLTAGEYTTAVGVHGLATGFGDTPGVGVGGITLGGGVGYLHRLHGLTIDSLIAAEIVTANGKVVHADEATHPDLFWAIRGGGGNFGVATRFRFRIHEVDAAVGGMLILPATPNLLATFVEAALEAPETLSGMINVMRAPPMPFLPAEHHGRPIVMAALLNAGAPEAGERALAPFRALAAPLVDGLRPLRYRDVYEGGPEPPPAPAVAVRSFFMDGFDLGAAETIFDLLERSTASLSVSQFRVLGGAVARVPSDATAFAHRQRAIMGSLGAVYERGEERSTHETWAREGAAKLRRGEPGAYVGFLGEEGEAGAREAYPGATWERLRTVKARYDPTNLFRLNQNVPPAARHAARS
jgi:FAD/FMN-containing dehydrogenase